MEIEPTQLGGRLFFVAHIAAHVAWGRRVRVKVYFEEEYFMLIVSLKAGANGARGNQLIYPALDSIPEGWAVVPPELEAEALEFLPWMTVEAQDGVITGIGDDAAARAAAEAADREDTGENNGSPTEE